MTLEFGLSLSFEWDAGKALGNLLKHGVSFREASSVFGDPHSVTIDDTKHSTFMEERHITLGLSERLRLLVVVHMERGKNVRIISARRATRNEERAYEEGC